METSETETKRTTLSEQWKNHRQRQNIPHCLSNGKIIDRDKTYTLSEQWKNHRQGQNIPQCLSNGKIIDRDKTYHNV
jgi:hypothetical protein